VTFAPAVAIWLHGPVEVEPCSILNAVSLEERSFQERLIWFVEAAVAERPSGGLGILCAVSETGANHKRAEASVPRRTAPFPAMVGVLPVAEPPERKSG
jgi:hypothetical protein